MPTCLRCGEENAERARFCSACGAPVEPGPATVEVRKTVTVVFCDVVNSTRLGELLDPEAHRRVIGQWFEAMRGAIEQHGGTVEKFIGDAVMALFGIPVLHEDDALRAVRAAAQMRGALAELNHELQRTWNLEIAIRTGVNTGEVVAGNPNTDQVLATGDAVVVARRLEQTAVSGEIRLGEATYQLVKEAVLAEEVGEVQAKGKRGIVAWRLLTVLQDAETTPVRLDSPLVGRELDLAALQGTLELAQSERSCRLLAVLGPAGIGKSRLTHEFIKAAGEQATVVRGRCLPYGDGITFWPLVEIVKLTAGLTERDSPEQARAKITSLLPATEEDAPLISDRIAAAIGRGEAVPRTEETFWAVRKLFEALAAERPLVVIFDDLQWAEETFFDLVEYLIGWSTGFPILLCCLARPELLDVRPSWNIPSRNRVVTVLEPLSDSDSERLIRNLVGDVPLQDEALGRISEVAEGNPLFVQELVRMLMDEDVIGTRAQPGFSRGDLDDLAIPPSINALLTARLDRLPPDERTVIQRASVVGQVFWWGAVAELCIGSVAGDVGSRLQSLVRKDLVRRERSTFAAEDAFRFGHILIRDAAYRAVPKERRADLHERLAGWLERQAAGRTEELLEIVGYHLEQAFLYRRELGAIDGRAGDVARRASERLGDAGRRALARGDSHAASSLLRRAIELREPLDPLRAELLMDLARAAMDSGDLARADALLDEALAAAEAHSDRRLEWRIRIDRVWLGVHLGKASLNDAIEVARESVMVFDEFGDDLGASRAWGVQANVRYVRGEIAEMERVLERALFHAQRAGDRAQTSSTLNAMARAALVGPTPVDEAVTRCEQLAEQSRGDLVLTAAITAFLSYLEAMRGQFEGARTLYGRSHAIFEELGRTVQLASVRMYAGAVELLAGDLAAAEQQLRIGYATLEEMGEKGNLSSHAALLAEVLHLQGRDDEAERYTAISEDMSPADDVLSAVWWRAARAKIWAQLGAVVDAERLAREAVSVAAETDYLNLEADALVSLGHVLGARGRGEEARSALLDAVRLYERKGNVVAAKQANTLLQETVVGS